MGTIPSSYTPAEWRNTTPADSSTNRIGVGFNMPDGTVLRLTLSQESARHLAETLDSHLTRVPLPQPSRESSLKYLPPEGYRTFRAIIERLVGVSSAPLSGPPPGPGERVFSPERRAAQLRCASCCLRHLDELSRDYPATNDLASDAVQHTSAFTSSSDPQPRGESNE